MLVLEVYPDKKDTNMRTLKERLERKVMPEPNSGCWLWLGAVNVQGYGKISLPGSKNTVQSHRAAYELFCGPLPQGAWVLHRCDNPLCVNPEHLFLGTPQDNSRDMVAKGRHDAHPRLSENAVREIRKRHAAGARQTDLAATFGVSRRQIGNIVERRNWKNVA
jgi:hypothetical protein